MSVVAMASFDKLRMTVANTLSRSVYDNPVVVREFRTRMRGWKAFGVMGLYVALMATVMLISYYMIELANSQSSYRQMPSDRIDVGQQLFIALTWAQSILLTLIIPALASGSLTQESEKKTMEMIALSPLSPAMIVVGKQLSYFLYASILLVCSLPLSGMCVMLGGISPAEVAVTYLLLAAWAFLLTCSGVLWSSLSKKTATASSNNYALSILYFIGTFSIGTMVAVAHYGFGGRMGLSPFSLLNPVWAPLAALERAQVCGLKIPLAAAALLLNVSFGALFLLIASTHVRYKRAERALSIRLLLLGVTVFTVWLAAGGIGMPLSKAMISGVGPLSLFVAAVGAAVFATGVVRKPRGQNMMEYALSGRRAFKTDIGGAICFVTLWVAVAYGAFGLTGFWAAKAASQTADVGFWACYAKVGVSILAIAAAMSAIGVLGSSLAKTRNAAAALVVLFVIVASAGYGVIMMQEVSPRPERFCAHLAAFWPLAPVLSATGDWPYKQVGPPWIDAAWIVTSAVYLVIGALALSLAGGAYVKTGGVVEE